MNALIAALSGLIFGIGLIASGMTDPAKVKGFLDLAGAWDPSLGLVMGGAIAVAVGAFTLAKRRERSWTGQHMELPREAAIDARLLGGGVLFGVGWGVAGYCPGPALVALGGGSSQAALFVLAMVAGVVLHDRLIVRR
jgi:uncharacterized protein